MFKQLMLIAFLFTGLVACKSKSAFNYSEAITAKDKSLEIDVKATEDKVSKYGAAQQFDSVAIAGENMEKIVQQKIDEINALPVPKAKGAEEFKAAALTYFKFIKSLYTGYKNAGNAKTDEERQAIVTELQQIVGEKQKILSDMQAAQRKYAEANGFKVQ